MPMLYYTMAMFLLVQLFGINRLTNVIITGRRAFPVFAANLWNSLPANLTSAPSLTIFRQRLKTRLFRRSYPDLII